MLFSILVYTFYFLLIALIPIFYSSYKLKKYVLLVLLFSAQFNVTCLLKLGVTFSFFEVALVLSALFSFMLLLRRHSFKILFFNADSIYAYFLIFSIVSICIAFIRLLCGNLPVTSEYGLFPLIRSLMSLNKPIFYLLIFIVRQDFIETFSLNDYRGLFIKYLAFSGIIPAVVVLLQFLSIGFVVIHNNPSYAENAVRIVVYNGVRVVGLANEAANFCYGLFFSYIGLFHAYCSQLIGKKNFLAILSLYIIAVVLTISRTGLAMFVIYTLYKYIWYNRPSIATILKLSVLCAVLLGSLSLVNLHGFNLYQRLLSTGDVHADLSTIERYGLTHALFNLAMDKGLVVGVGIYNYFYYLKDYLPDYVTMNISYEYGYQLPSFNFVLQLWAEYGLFFALLFFVLVIRMVRKCKDPLIKEWFLFLLFFAFSFQILNFSVPFLIFLYPPLTWKEPSFKAPYRIKYEQNT